MTLIPRGITPAAKPCKVRPTTSGTTDALSAPMADPTTSRARPTRSILRLPYMSPRRPIMGTATAPASNVAVITQAVFDADVFSSVGSWGISGMTKVCMSATTTPAHDRTATI